jgi:hypothetical protein
MYDLSLAELAYSNGIIISLSSTLPAIYTSISSINININIVYITIIFNIKVLIN